MKERIVMQGVYPERIQLGDTEGRIVVEKTRWTGGRVQTMVTVEAGHNGRLGSYSLSANSDGPLGKYLAQRSAVETLVEVEDCAREIIAGFAELAAPSELCELTIKTFRNIAEVAAELNEIEAG